ncbi:hypothetical protein EHS25_004920 [Saitozyma podzolica]|uniref:Uncharacterized protein n=1 Tax=Saitozyma podzolica TaxID=1890683 RepID=A0A427Y328_9TREE|nr:hypothetical protein EHS25_004920 [Saitozyma podzolica]
MRSAVSLLWALAMVVPALAVPPHATHAMVGPQTSPPQTTCNVCCPAQDNGDFPLGVTSNSGGVLFCSFPA